jgi:hypothetical protein
MRRDDRLAGVEEEIGDSDPLIALNTVRST